MAEFCLECFNELNKCRLRPLDVRLSKELEFCENCEEFKKNIVSLHCKIKKIKNNL